MVITPAQWSDISAATITKVAPKIIRQISVKCPLLSFIPCVEGPNSNVLWDIYKFGSNATTYSDGDTEIADAGYDKYVVAQGTLDYANLAAAFRVSEPMRTKAKRTGGPAGLQTVWTGLVEDAMFRLVGKIRTDVYTGTGADNIIGLQSAVDASATYGGVTVASFAEHRSYDTSKSGAAFEKGFLDDLVFGVYDQSSNNEMPDAIFAPIAGWVKMKKVLDVWRNDIGVTDQGTVKLDPGVMALAYNNIPIIFDPSMPASSLLAINTRFLEMQYMPVDVEIPNAITELAEKVELEADGNVLGLKEKLGLIFTLQKSNDNSISVDGSLIGHPQLVCNRRNAHGWLTNIDFS